MVHQTSSKSTSIFGKPFQFDGWKFFVKTRLSQVLGMEKPRLGGGEGRGSRAWNLVDFPYGCSLPETNLTTHLKVDGWNMGVNPKMVGFPNNPLLKMTSFRCFGGATILGNTHGIPFLLGYPIFMCKVLVSGRVKHQKKCLWKIPKGLPSFFHVFFCL